METGFLKLVTLRLGTGGLSLESELETRVGDWVLT